MTVFAGARSLLEAFRRGDRAALETVYFHYVDDIAAMVRHGFSLPASGVRVRGATDEATERDLIQEVFSRAFAPRARDAYDGIRPYAAYLRRIARNLMIDRVRTAGRDVAFDDDDGEPRSKRRRRRPTPSGSRSAARPPRTSRAWAPSCASWSGSGSNLARVVADYADKMAADDEACHDGVCQPTSHDDCGPTGAACAADATCSDTAGALACTCNAGYAGDGLSCADVDECAASTPACTAHATCSNMPGSFACACDAGFTGDASASYCVPARFTKIAAAGGFSCGLAANGGIYCWGHNAFGDVGDGSGLPRARPTQVGTATDWIDVDAHTNVGCGLRVDHSMWCWGFGANGQLGDGRAMDQCTPTKVISDKPGVGWKAMALGRQRLCGLHDDGSLACWGHDLVTGNDVTAPAAVDGNTDWTAISAGTVMCGLRGAPGHLYCWGRSTNGELGLGTTTSQATPAQVGTDTWRRVGVGYYNTCAIRSDGALFCWGDNPLTTTALKYGNTPQQIGTATDWQAVSLSSGSILGLRTGGLAYVWGTNESGQLGVPLAQEITAPTPISGQVTGWSRLNAGNTHGCGIANDQAYCWGTVFDGFLGDGRSTALYAPKKIGTEHWTALASGPGTCGLRDDGALMCWGFDIIHGVGFGNTDPVWAPTRLGTQTWSAVAGTASSVGQACAIRGGTPYCWGNNSTGQLGVGTTTTPQLSPVAVKVPVNSQWTQIAISNHTCAIASDAKLWCWGANDHGELGTGATSAPVTAPLAALAGAWRQVVVAMSGFSSAMTCGIKTDHTLWCWGEDRVMATPRRVVPTQVGSEASWDTVSLAADGLRGVSACAVKLNGTLWCWGVRLGDGTPAPSAEPVQVGTANTWKSVTVGSEICAIKAEGTLWCWANGGLLGDGVVQTWDQSSLETTTPTQLAGADWATVMTESIDSSISCATKTDGSLWCWGSKAAPVPGIVTTPVPIR